MWVTRNDESPPWQLEAHKASFIFKPGLLTICSRFIAIAKLEPSWAVKVS
jgi:hypothetical protein